MSYSLQAIYTNATWAMATHSQALGRLQDQVATGQELNRMSDNPTYGSRILDLKADSRSKAVYRRHQRGDQRTGAEFVGDSIDQR